MALSGTLYKITDDKIVVKKHADASHKLADISLSLKGDCDIMSPVLEVAYSADVMSANYLYVSTWGRYYYIEDKILSSQRVILQLSEDVLMTYKTDILKLKCVVARQENNYNTYLNDGVWRNLQAKDVLTLRFSKNGNYTTFYKPCNFVLTTGGEPT